ncbi:snRNA/snoRNA cap hypermethylase [Intoshia linei]|uniref:Trimethylguanosine synthase n=1 Tax=Intoshia linei TaxID=1819745 RepID=A0A177AXX8_9BILA|nr:snRNA/snoRNA cap hypermethylase [Intoshia linei]
MKYDKTDMKKKRNRKCKNKSKINLHEFANNNENKHICFDKDESIPLNTLPTEFYDSLNSQKIEVTSDILKYWNQRYKYFVKFDCGIQMDKEAWYSVCPEQTAIHIASRLPPKSICINAFCGVGSLSIKIAEICSIVYCIDINPDKITMAKHNASVYGSSDKIEFIVGDYFDVINNFAGISQVIMLDPPWGGPEYILSKWMDPNEFNIPNILHTALQICPNVGVLLPRNLSIDKFKKCLPFGLQVELEQNLINTKYKTITAYFGSLIPDNIY